MTRNIYTDEMLTLQDWLKSLRKSQNLTMHNLATRWHDLIHLYKVEQSERRLDVIEYIW